MMSTAGPMMNALAVDILPSTLPVPAFNSKVPESLM